jgi:hypothetical protein
VARARSWLYPSEHRNGTVRADVQRIQDEWTHQAGWLSVPASSCSWYSGGAQAPGRCVTSHRAVVRRTRKYHDEDRTYIIGTRRPQSVLSSRRPASVQIPNATNECAVNRSRRVLGLIAVNTACACVSGFAALPFALSLRLGEWNPSHLHPCSLNHRLWIKQTVSPLL